MIPYTPTKPGLIPYAPGGTPKVAPAPQPTSLEGKLRADSNYGSQVGAEEVAGFKKIGASISKGAQDIQKGAESKNVFGAVGNIVKGVTEAGLGTVAGAGRAVLAPFTPAVSGVISPIIEHIKKDPSNPKIITEQLSKVHKAISDWSAKHPDATTITEDAINDILLGLGGGASETAPIKEALSKEGVQAVKEDIAGTVAKGGKSIEKKLEGTTPKNVDEFIDKKYPKAISPSSKKSVALSNKQIENNREAVKLINDNKSGLEFKNPDGSTYDSGRVPENIYEHAQALSKTKQDLWNKISGALKEKNVIIPMDDIISKIKSKMKEVTTASNQYKYLQEMLNKYSTLPSATPDQFNKFLTELNDDGKAFFESGSDKAKATTSAEVGNMFRETLDRTAQQIGTPEVSLWRKQYGALASSDKDVARALAKQMKGTGSGGVSGLADLFSGEEIARGILLANPKAVLSGAALQGTKFVLKWLRNPNRVIKKLYSTLEEVSSKSATTGDKIPRMESSFSPKERAGLPAIKGNPNTAKTPGVIEMPGKIGGFDEAQAKMVGGLKNSEGIKNYIDKNDGITVDAEGNTPSKGFSVSPSKATETRVPADKFSSSDVDKFKQKFSKELSKPGAHFGAWKDGKDIFLDVSAVSDNIKDAIKIAKKGKQDAIYDISSGQSIYAKDFDKYLNDLEDYTPEAKLPVIKFR